MREALDQMELAGAQRRFVTAVHVELVVDVANVRSDGVGRNAQVNGDIRARQIGAEQAQDIQLSVAE